MAEKNLGRVVGLSAYEVAKQQGFDGSETEWLSSLKGDKGDTGAPGAQGVTGATGAPGATITDISRTSGNGAPGTTDTYTITMSDGTKQTFTVYNGADGKGAGDMTALVYDPQGKKEDIFKYVDDRTPATETWTFELEDGTTVTKSMCVSG